MVNWYTDPALIMEKIDNQRSCEVCRYNDFTKDSTGRKDWYCKLWHNQSGGTRTKDDCRDFLRKDIP